MWLKWKDIKIVIERSSIRKSESLKINCSPTCTTHKELAIGPFISSKVRSKTLKKFLRHLIQFNISIPNENIRKPLRFSDASMGYRNLIN